MNKKEKQPNAPEEEAPSTAETEPVLQTEAECIPDAEADEADLFTAQLAQQEEKFLRLAAEYDNFRKRSQKEKESAWAEAKMETALAFLPVYDNLERAVKQQTCDEAYAKGVDMTMTGLKEILTKVGIVEIDALGQPFDPNLHNAVMHVEDESVGQSTIVEVFQTGFKLGEKVMRFAMVKVAN